MTEEELHERTTRAMDAAQRELGLPPDVSAILVTSTDIGGGETAIAQVVKAKADAVFVMLDAAMGYFLHEHPEYRERIANAVAAARPSPTVN